MLSSARLRAGMQETLLDGTECSKHPDSPLTYTIELMRKKGMSYSLSCSMSYSLLENPKYLFWDPDEKGLAFLRFQWGMSQGRPVLWEARVWVDSNHDSLSSLCGRLHGHSSM